jgi:hypothetical protein
VVGVSLELRHTEAKGKALDARGKKRMREREGSGLVACGGRGRGVRPWRGVVLAQERRCWAGGVRMTHQEERETRSWQVGRLRGWGPATEREEEGRDEERPMGGIGLGWDLLAGRGGRER